MGELLMPLQVEIMQIFILMVGVLVDAEPTVGRYVKFVRNLFFAPQDLKYSNSIIFDQNHGEVNREKFKRDYGHQGEFLVDAYGKGLSKKELQRLGFL